MKEKDRTPFIFKWAREHLSASALIEIKMAKGDSLPFVRLAPHQKIALQLAAGKGMYFKIPDCGYQSPTDGFVFKQALAFVAVIFDKEFFFILIQNWCHEEENCKRKSLTKTRAKEIASYEAHF